MKNDANPISLQTPAKSLPRPHLISSAIFVTHTRTYILARKIYAFRNYSVRVAVISLKRINREENRALMNDKKFALFCRPGLIERPHGGILIAGLGRRDNRKYRCYRTYRPALIFPSIYAPCAYICVCVYIHIYEMRTADMEVDQLRASGFFFHSGFFSSCRSFYLRCAAFLSLTRIL